MVYRQESGGGAKRNRRRNKSKSNSNKLYGIAKPASDEYVNAVLNGMLLQSNMGGNTVPLPTFNVGPQTTMVAKDSIPGGEKMQKIAPPVIMEPKRLAPTIGLENTQPMDAQSNSIDMLTNLAMDMLTQPGASYDYESAMQQAAHGIRQAYAAEIGAIRSNNKAYRRDTKKARKQIEHLYNGLAKQLGRDSVRAENQGDRDARDQMRIAGQGTDALSQLNQQLIGDETSMLQNLGLQDAAPALVSPDYDRMGAQIADLTGEGTRAAQLANRQGDAQSRYMRRSQAGARFEGADQSAALIGQLQDYLRQNRGQIGVLKGNRAKEVAASNASIQGQAAQMAADQNSQTWDQVMELLNNVSDIENTNFQNQLEANKFQWDQKMDKRGLRLDQQKMLNSQQNDAAGNPMANYAPNLEDAFSIIAQTRDPGDRKATAALLQLFGDNAFRKDQVDLGNGETAKLTVFEAMAMARKKGLSMGLQGRELNDFIMAAAASVA